MMTVRELAARGRFPCCVPFARMGEADERYIDKALSLAGVFDLRDRPLQSWSGGQRQRARMAMVLAQDTPIVLLDEPTSFMDVAACFDMARLIRRVQARGKTVVAVIHDLNMTLSVGDCVFMMERGCLAAQGEPESECVCAAVERSFGVRLERAQAASGTAWVPFEHTRDWRAPTTREASRPGCGSR